MTVTLKRAVKMRGTRFAPGATVDATDAEYSFLVTLGCIDATPQERTTTKVRVQRSPEERAEALKAAQERVAVATGHAVPVAADTPAE